MSADSGTGIQSVSRAVSILRCFAGNKELGLTEISKKLGLHKSTASGIIATLKREGFIEQNEQTGKLRMGIDLFSLAMSACRGLDEICEPHLNKLLELTGETVNLAILSRDRVVFIAKKESAHSVRIGTSVGIQLPIHCTAVGKAMLAVMDREKVEKMIDDLQMMPFTNKTITSRARLLEELDMIESEGIACDIEEYEPGVICVAAPLCSMPNNPVGAISVSGPAMRMDARARRNISAILRNTTVEISERLSCLG